MTSNENEGESPYGPQYGQERQAYGRPAYQPYGEQSTSGYTAPQPAYGQYPTQAYDRQYPAPAGYPQAAYGQYGQYGQVQPAPRPGGVVTSAVLGFVWGALGAIATVVFMAGGAFFSGASGSAETSLPGLGAVAGAAAGAFIFLGVLALAWTVVMFWGSAWALSGRSRVLLIVGGSISIATTGFAFFASLGSNSTASSIIVPLVLFALSILMVVLLSRKDAASFYAAKRSQRVPR